MWTKSLGIGNENCSPQLPTILVIDHVKEIAGSEITLISLLEHYHKGKYQLIPLIPGKGELSQRLDELVN